MYLFYNKYIEFQLYFFSHFTSAAVLLCSELNGSAGGNEARGSQDKQARLQLVRD